LSLFDTLDAHTYTPSYPNASAKLVVAIS